MLVCLTISLKGLEEPKHDSRVSRQVRKFFFPSSNIIRRMKGIAREITNNARDKERKRERERERETLKKFRIASYLFFADAK